MIREEIHDLLAYDGLKIIQRKDLFRFSLDSLLLGDFVRINQKANKILDLGTGLGPIPFYLSLKTDKPIIGIEIQDDMIELAKKSVVLNALENQVTITKCDMRDLRSILPANSIDIVTVNPPFFKYHDSSFVNKLDSQTMARHEITIDLEGVIQAAKQMVSTGGTFFMIHRANRIDEIFLRFQENRFIVKRMRFVFTKHDKPATMVMVEAKFNGNHGSLIVEEPLYIYERSGEYTKEVLRIFHLGDVLYDSQSELSE
ncbi:MAG: methyltransferase [Bacilli bacterium]|nr:methyltransferase [Bacilli bacterium]MBN2876989.1 methyltransferase [Bacilli bacterium]